VVNTVELFTASPEGRVVTGRFASVMGKQMPLLHMPPRQPWPQAPQLFPSLERFAQALGQAV
jgi:hypothetical protein